MQSNDNKAEIDFNIRDKIREEQVRLLFSLSKNGLLTTILIGIFVYIVFSPIFSHLLLFKWLSSLSILVFLRYVLILIYDKYLKKIKNIHWLQLFGFGSTITGLMWGIATIIFFPIERPLYQPLICILVVGMTAGAVPFLSAVPLIYILFSLPALLPFAFFMFHLNGNTYTVLGISTLVYVFMNVVSSLRIGNTIVSNIKMNIERGLLIEDLQKAKCEAENADKAKSVFVSSMSHELRTPLNAILGYSQLLNSYTNDLSQEMKDEIKEINTAGNHLLDLIDDILDLSKIEANLLKLDIITVNLVNILEKCIAIISPTANKQNINIKIINNANTPIFVMADKGKIRQILLNILSNAVKYNKLKGSITITLTKDNENAKIAIADTGKGIPEKKIKDLFTPFNRLGIENTNLPGTGLGLVISQKLINLMNGTIEVTSKEGIGSSFNLILPLSHSTPKISSNTEIMSFGEILPNNNATYSILYIEDNETNIKLLEKILKKLRPSVTFYSAETGQDGIKLAEKLEPDIILCDIQLPDISGFEVARDLKLNSKFQKTPIIALSADANIDIIKKGLTTGFTNYQTKPFQINKLLNSLDEVIKNI